MSKASILIYRIVYQLYIWKVPIIPEAINKLFLRILLGCQIGTGARLGKGVNLGYGGLGIVIHPRAVIGNNVNIGTGVTVGGMSLVNSFIPPYCIAVGIPAKKFKKRFDDIDDLSVILQNVKSKYTIEEINKIYKRYDLEY